MSECLNGLTTAIMARRSTQLGGGGNHMHKIFGLSVNKNLNPHRMAELAIQKIMSDPILLHLLQTLDILFFDEIGQNSAENTSVIDIAFRHVRNNNIPFGGLHIIASMDHCQLTSPNGKSFLMSSLILTSFVMIELVHSVCAHSDPQFQRVQAITHMHPSTFDNDESIIPEARELINNIFTFVDNWQSPLITPNTF